MDVEFEMLGKDKVVISLKDFRNMLDIIAYDEAKTPDNESFPESLTRKIIAGENRLKVFRKHRNLSQMALSQKSGVPQGLISEIENDKKTGSIQSLKAIARALDLNVDDLLA